MAGLRLLAREDGQAIVEFALIIPFLLVAVVGILVFSRAMNYNSQETHLVNEAARFAAVGQVPPGPSPGATWSSLGQFLRSQAVGELGHPSTSTSISGTPTVCISYPDGGSNAVGNRVTVSMSFNWNWAPVKIKLPGGGTLTQSTLLQQATMRIESPPTAGIFSAGCT